MKLRLFFLGIFLLLVGLIARQYFLLVPPYTPYFFKITKKFGENKVYKVTFNINDCDSIILCNGVPYINWFKIYNADIVKDYSKNYKRFERYNNSFFDYDNVSLIIFCNDGKYKFKVFNNSIYGRSLFLVTNNDLFVIKNNTQYKITTQKNILYKFNKKFKLRSITIEKNQK